MKLGLILLTFNEIDGVSALAGKIPTGEFDETVVIDGGSTDGTVEFLKGKGFAVLSQRNRGRGDAFRQAFAETTADALVFYSPDGNEALEDLSRFRPLLEEGCDIVIASRMMEGAHNEEDDQLFKPRKWANNAFNWIANTVWNRGAAITDTINGYRAITRAAWDELKPDSLGFSIEYQMSIRAMKRGKRVKEIPTREGERIGGESKAASLPTGLRFLRLLWRELRVGDAF